MKLIVGMFAMGSDLYYAAAQISAPSFLRANPDCDLVLFTDRPAMFWHLEKFEKFRLASYPLYANKDKRILREIDAKIDHPRCDRNGGIMGKGHFYRAIYGAMFPIMLQWYAQENGYNWCLMVDVDSYFIGDMIGYLQAELEANFGTALGRKHFVFVERSHPEMSCFDECGAPGAGFVMWQVASRYIERYITLFKLREQNSFWQCIKDTRILRSIRLLRPGYHFVYPFRVNANFSKERALHFAPAYYHIGIPDFLAKMRKMDEWFNPEIEEKKANNGK